MLFREVAEVFSKLEQISGRLESTALLAQLFRKSTPEEAKYISYFISGELLPSYYGIDLGIGEKMALEVISKVSGHSTREVERKYKELGDVGRTAQYFLERRKQKPLFSRKLSVADVYQTLLKISKISGEGSKTVKERYFAELLNNALPIEAVYITRFAIGKLRMGIGVPTLLDALSWAKIGGKGLREYVERAFNLCSDIGMVAELFLQNPEAIRKFKIELFKPLQPALAERLSSPEEIFSKLGKCAVEYKYDGFRMQVHKKEREVKIFSRRLEDLTYMFPDVIEDVKNLPVKEIIFEGEALAYNEKYDRFYSFQQTMHRRRKYGIEEASKEYPLYVYVFDIMYLDGKELIDLPFSERRKILEQLFPFGRLKRTHFRIANTPAEIKEMFEEAIRKDLEGIMAKDLNAPYTAGKRGFAWIKLKKSYSEMLDTIDGVIVGYFYGTGARARFGIGAVLIAVYNDELDTFQTVAKVATGFTEQELIRFKKMLDEIRTEKPAKNLEYRIEADVWVEPRYVIEVGFDEITISKQHTCAQQGEVGLALRFPKFIRLREDKGPYEATTAREIEQLFYLQRQKKS